jgi:hypothetical protein
MFQGLDEDVETDAEKALQQAALKAKKSEMWKSMGKWALDLCKSAANEIALKRAHKHDTGSSLFSKDMNKAAGRALDQAEMLTDADDLSAECSGVQGIFNSHADLGDLSTARSLCHVMENLEKHMLEHRVDSKSFFNTAEKRKAERKSRDGLKAHDVNKTKAFFGVSYAASEAVNASYHLSDAQRTAQDISKSRGFNWFGGLPLLRLAPESLKHADNEARNTFTPWAELKYARPSPDVMRTGEDAKYQLNQNDRGTAGRYLRRISDSRTEQHARYMRPSHSNSDEDGLIKRIETGFVANFWSKQKKEQLQAARADAASNAAKVPDPLNR